jgi:hypothetical protein
VCALRIVLVKLARDGIEQLQHRLEDLVFGFVHAQRLQEQRKVFLEIHEVVVDVLHGEAYLRGLAKLVQQELEGAGLHLLVAFDVEFVAAIEQFGEDVDVPARLFQLQAENLDVPRNGFLAEDEHTAVHEKVDGALGFHKVSLLTFGLLRSGRVEALQLDLLDLAFDVAVGKRFGSPSHLFLLPCHLLLDLQLALGNEPFDQPTVVLLRLNVPEMRGY